MTEELASLYTAPICTLRSATNKLVISGEVQLVLQSLLDDVETTQSLNLDLKHLRQVQDLQKELKDARAELEERRACDAVQTEQLHSAGDVFVGELFVLSKKMSTLQQEVERNLRKLEQFDSMQQKLERSEELVRTLQRTMSLNRDAYCLSSSSEPNAADEGLRMPRDNSNARVEVEHMVMETVPPSALIVPEDNSLLISKQNIEEGDPNLENLDETLILHIFSYLDAIDVVHTAMVNVSFYARVDSLFGLSGSSSAPTSKSFDETKMEGKDADKKAPTTACVVNESSVPSVAATKQSNSTPVSIFSGTGDVTQTNFAADSTPSSVTFNTAHRTVQSSSTMEVSKKSTTPPLAPVPQPRNALANVLSILGQPKTPQATNKKTPTITGTSAIASEMLPPSSASVTSSSDATKSFASMANSMADKLTPAELAVIIRMTEQIRAKDRETSKIKAEREDLAARLEGTEAVKEFLISRIKDCERSQKKFEEEAAKTLLQYSSDQEVISFLDYRVKELERFRKETKDKLAVEQKNYQDFQDKSEKRQIVLEDMLQFERQQLADSEREWKATKKVLVKEVKHCRAQKFSLQSERDSYRHKNLQLKQALLTMNGGIASSGGGPKK